MVDIKWLKANCSECGQEFEYPKDSLYKPETCGRLDCELKRQHPELNRIRGEGVIGKKTEQKVWNWDYTRWAFAVAGTLLILIGASFWVFGNQDGRLTIPCIVLVVCGSPLLLCSLLIEKWKK